jgi:hypothetical protein
MSGRIKREVDVAHLFREVAEGCAGHGVEVIYKLFRCYIVDIWRLSSLILGPRALAIHSRMI